MVDMQIIFLGTSAAIPTWERGLSSIAIRRGNELLLFDTGEGMQRNYVRAGLRMNNKTKIFITHMHSDHCVGILGLLQTMSLQGRQTAIDIYGHPRLAEFLQENIRIINFRLEFDVNIHVIYEEGIVVREKEYEVSCCEAHHSIPAYSYYIRELERPGIFNIDEAKRLGIPPGPLYHKLQHGEDITYNGNIIKSYQIAGPSQPGRKIGISGDTRPTDKLIDFFKDCDLLIFESTYEDEKYTKAIESFHSTATDAAIVAKKSHVKKLILTHFSARYKKVSNMIKEASAIYNNVEAAEDLKIVTIPYRSIYE